MKKRGFTLIELLVVIAIIAMLLAILMPALNKVKKIAQRVVCGTNLKGLGNAQVVYANDFDGDYACQNTAGTASQWGETTPNWAQSTLGNDAQLTVGASLYLLVRLADVSPKSFVCPASDQQEFSGKNPSNKDIVDLWDFGTYVTGTPPAGVDDAGPAKCVSYAYHQPYVPVTGSLGEPGAFRADDQRSAAFALMADRNPWYDTKITVVGTSGFTGQDVMNRVGPIGRHWETNPTLPAGTTLRQNVMIANAYPHEREGQNVLFADGHSSFEKTADVGIKNDNIYNPQVNPVTTSPDTWRMGNNGVHNATGTGGPARSNNLRPINQEDSYLVNDFVAGTFTR